MDNIILHQIGNTVVGLKAKDGYINATAMAKGHRERTGQKKNVADWLRLDRTKETIQHLSLNMGIPAIKLYQVFQGAPETGGGTWIHPRLAVRFGIWLSDDFGLTVENWLDEWQKYKTNHHNIEWLEARNSGKRNRRQETDAIKVFIDYAKSQGSQSAEKYYLAISKMENKALFLVEQKYPNLRDILGIAELGLIAVADTIVARALAEGIEKAMHYKDIYKLAKERVEVLASAHGKVAIPSAIQPGTQQLLLEHSQLERQSKAEEK